MAHINSLNIKIFDYIFSINEEIRNNLYVVDKEKYNHLNEIIEETTSSYDFWCEYKCLFNENKIIDSSTLSDNSFTFCEFPKMKLETKKEYLEFKKNQIYDYIKSNGEFDKDYFVSITIGMSDISRKAILDYLKNKNILKYHGSPYVFADDNPAYCIIYQNIEAVLMNKEERINMNIINIGDNNKIESSNLAINSNVNDKALFDNVLKLLETSADDFSKEDINKIKNACSEKDKNKILEMLKDIFSKIGSSVLSNIFLKFLGF